jgi:hypothetical protein
MPISGHRILLLTLCVAGCSFDFTGIADRTRAGFNVEIIASAEADRLDIQAGLSPGHNDNGNLRTVLTDLFVGGRAVPSAEGPGGTRAYQAEWSLAAALSTDGRLEIRAPDVDGVPFSATPAFDVALPMRTGADTVHVAPGDDVILHVTAPAGTATNAYWRITVIDSTGITHFAVEANADPPAQITIPRSWFPQDSPVFEVSLQVRQAFASETASDQYAGTATVEALLHWTVVFATGPGT